MARLGPTAQDAKAALGSEPRRRAPPLEEAAWLARGLESYPGWRPRFALEEKQILGRREGRLPVRNMAGGKSGFWEPQKRAFWSLIERHALLKSLFHEKACC